MEKMKIEKQFFRFLIVGALGTAVDFGVYFFAVRALPYDISKALSYLVGSILGYFLNKHWTFCQPRDSAHEVGRYWLGQLLLLGFNVAINHIVLTLIQSVVLAVVMATGVTGILSFTLKKWWIFTKNKGTPLA